MPINPSIAMGYRAPRIAMPDPEAEMGRGLQLKSLLMQQQAAERAQAEDQAQREAFRSSGGDQAAYLQALVRGGNLKGYQSAIEFEEKRKKAQADLLKVGADTANTQATTNQTLTKIDAEKLTQHNNLLAGVSTPEQAQAWIQAGLQSGAIKPHAVPMLEQTFANAQTPDAFQGAIQKLSLGMSKYIEQNKPTTFQHDSGGAITTYSRPGLGGAATPVQATPRVMTPGEIATDKRTREEGAANRGVQIRGQNLTNKRALERLDFERTNDSGDPTQTALTKQFGKPSPGYRWKANGAMEAIPGGPADQKSQAQDAGRQTVDSVVSQLRQSYESLDKGGGITSTEQGPIANLGRRASQSAIGQFAGGAVGSVNQKERDAIAQARPLLLQAIMKATGMSAKQMDSNAELKLYLATATDPTLSLQANREALDRIAELYGSGAIPGGASGSFGTPPSKTNAGASVSGW